MKNKDFLYQHPHTVWESIKADLELDIINDVYKMGDRVPSLNEIAKKYDISLTTAGKVLETLKEEEIIMKKRGVGYFVLPYGKMKLLKKSKAKYEEKLSEVVEGAKVVGCSLEQLLSDISMIWNNNPHRED